MTSVVKNRLGVVHGSSIVEEDDPGPPTDFIQPFESMEAWLHHVCNGERPRKLIANYRFALYEGENDYTLCLTGTNTYELSENHVQIRIDFAPTDMYFQVPEHEYKGLSREQVLEQITAQLKEFTGSQVFQHSFLKEAQTIATEWNGAIWSR